MKGSIGLRALDEELADLLLRLEPIANPDEQRRRRTLYQLVGLQLKEGHLCLDLDAPPAWENWPADIAAEESEREATYAWLKDGRARAELAASRLVSSEPEKIARPIALAGNRVYWHRYWSYERRIALRLVELAQGAPLETGSDFLSQFARFFPNAAADPEDRQALAARRSCTSDLLVVSGGPGAGKTATVARILALHRAQRPGLRAALAAPTGKAAARLKDSIASAFETLTKDGGDELAAPEVSTLHRLLEPIAYSSEFRRNARRPLDIDLLIIDEASMIDLPLLARTLDALPRNAGLILLGDRDQLASVEAGAAFAEIAASPALSENVTTFTRNYRFDSKSGIAALAQAIRAGEAQAALGIVHANDRTDLENLGQEDAALRQQILRGYETFARASEPAAALAAFEEFRVLAALRAGRYGVDALNQLTVRTLIQAGLAPRTANVERLFPGCPLLITQNDYNLGLFNGDIGVTFPDDQGALQAWFRGDGASELRRFPVVLLPPYEICYAMTVHKSQGSEFKTTLFVLPEIDSPALTRETVYTAVTRARKRAVLFGDSSILERAIERKTVRISGLAGQIEAVKTAFRPASSAAPSPTQTAGEAATDASAENRINKKRGPNRNRASAPDSQQGELF